MKIGIDKIGFYAPDMYVDTEDLAHARGVEPGKFTVGIGQEKMAVAPKTQDAVTLAANAANNILTKEDIESIDYIIFATETGIDHSKAAAIYVQRLLGLNDYARSIEVKQACYSATAGVQMARGHIALNPDSKVLILASDISRYGLKTGGEITQGAGAVAMVISADPHVLAIEETSVYKTEDAMDFWRPLYSDYAYVQGKFSVDQYINFFQDLLDRYKEKTNRTFKDFSSILFHLPYTKMGLKALKSTLEHADEEDRERLLTNFDVSKRYNAIVGNIYTGSLYLSLLSLLERNTTINEGERVGLFSYGSGSVGEFLTGIVQPNYKDHLFTDQHDAMLNKRQKISVEQYEEMYEDKIPAGEGNVELDASNDPAPIRFTGIKEHMRQYENVSI
ncbi:hydroxymethylglutaryl-CoA synthase [Pelagirhabdus alkalitolerans]|uniref:Hydroxymethylglutaryl-CoA synthase n=1 Tax=Pelagirhabdus alkalitolerans TaxID=1612202 RepID=A0A1G6H858_9BACI|nr:hydroxymethylglutaryl-CoA synthase [Pelagirhabdus alkalitolerans]SDB90343.1 hydroxymethylglutaryl-CoA synthase [Pelagirhabdus alkalitolerans]